MGMRDGNGNERMGGREERKKENDDGCSNGKENSSIFGFQFRPGFSSLLSLF